MELLCPNCQQKLTIQDQYAGQVMRCPMCNGTFTAPALAPAPAPSAPVVPAAAPASYGLAPEPPPPPLPPPGQDVARQASPPPIGQTPVPPGQYTRTVTIRLNPRVVPWVAPVCLFFAFLLTFFPWVSFMGVGEIMGASFSGPSAWSLGFGEHSTAMVALYLILLLIALLLSIALQMFALNLAPTPPVVQNLGAFRSLLVGAITLLAFLLLFTRYLEWLFRTGMVGGTTWWRLSILLILTAVIGCMLEFWLERRKRRNLPPPRIELSW